MPQKQSDLFCKQTKKSISATKMTYSLQKIHIQYEKLLVHYLTITKTQTHSVRIHFQLRQRDTGPKNYSFIKDKANVQN